MLGPALAGLSVVVTVPPDDAGLGPTLAALIAQSSSDERFEVIIASPSPVAAAVVEPAAVLRPSLPVRTVVRHTVAEADQADLRNLALAAATRPFVTFVASGDEVGPRFVDTLLDVAEPDLIGAVPVLGPDHALGAATEPSGPAADNVVILDPQRAPEVLATTEGRAFSTPLAREVRFRSGAVSGRDADFAVRYWLRRDVRVALAHGRVAAAYQATAEPTVTEQLQHRQRAVLDQIAAARRLGELLDAAPDEAAGDVVRYHQRRAAAAINRYLHRHPDEHAAVLHEIRRSGARHFPYPELNANLADTLIVSFCFPPAVDTSGIVMAKRVHEYGRIVDVISNNENTAQLAFDPGTERIAEEYVDRHVYVKAPRVFTGSWSAITTFADLALGAAAEREAAHGPYGLVRSRAMWIAAHVPAALLRGRRPELRWSAEMSDPLSRDVHGELREAPLPPGDPLVIELRAAARERGREIPPTDHLGVFVEHVAYALADELVFTNPQQRAYMLGYCPVPDLARRAAEISVVRPQPTLPERFYELETVDLDDADAPGGPVRLAYFGNLYANRSLEDAVGAIADLPGDWRGRVHLAVFTSTPDLVREQVSRLGLADVIEVQRYVPYLQFLNVLRRFDCLVIEDVATAGSAHDVNPYLPSKWSDYRGSGTAVWGILEPDSPLSTERLEYRSLRGDRADAVATLRQIVLDHDQMVAAAGSTGRALK